MSKVQITPKWSEVKPQGYYVYIHRRATDGSVFYVGKGSYKRGWNYHDRSKKWRGVYEQHGATIEVIWQGDSQYCASTIEKIKIAIFRMNGYELANTTKGGELGGGHINKRPVYSSLGEFFESCSSAGEWIRKNENPIADYSTISQCALGKSSSAHGRAWSYEDFPPHPNRVGLSAKGGPCKAVYCSNGMKFNSLSDACSWLRTIGNTLNPCTSAISGCCLGKRLTSYGYAWSHDHIPLEPKSTGKQSNIDAINRKRVKPVFCSNGMSFDSSKDAVLWLLSDGHDNASNKQISSCATGKSNIAFGLMWSYRDIFKDGCDTDCML